MPAGAASNALQTRGQDRLTVTRAAPALLTLPAPAPNSAPQRLRSRNVPSETL
jgi:hypothetical protein